MSVLQAKDLRMKRMIYLLMVLLLFSPVFSLNAEERLQERVLVYTDKDCYLTGEYILLKFSAVTPNFAPSGLSKVGYVEISNTQNPCLQLMLALENGTGSGKIKIPSNVPSGIYELSGYTRYMRNEGEDEIFKSRIAIINPEQRVSSTTVELVSMEDELQEIKIEMRSAAGAMSKLCPTILFMRPGRK